MSANHAAKLEAKFRHALDLHQQGKEKQASKLYHSVLNARPQHSGALHYLGLMSHQQGDSDAAIRLMSKAIQHQPDYIDAILNLGNVYQEQERFSEAEEYYRQAIALQPGEAAAHSNLSVSLRRQEHLQAAIAAGRKAVELDPEYLIAWYNLGNAYKVVQDYKKAVACYQEAILLKPDLTLAHDALCQSTFQLEYRSTSGKSDFSETTAAYEQWLACEPDNSLAQFMLQAIKGDTPMMRAPDDVVRGMFDQFASSFEEHLQSLDYNLPQTLTPLLLELLGPPQADLKVLDGGCGTGLCAPALKPYANRLVGVDISAAMLERARQKQLYDGLIESELTLFLQQYTAAFDLVVYADTLVYFGDLQDILHASAQALTRQGTLVFSLEASIATGKNSGYSLHPNGRYRHTADYVQKLLQSCGFSQIHIGSDSTRQEIGKAVAGLVVSARKQ